MLYFGCPQWGMPQWKGEVFTQDCKSDEMLTQYASMFNSVEGNTTFYATPSQQTIKRWYDAVPNDFRFTFKLPKTISHESALQSCGTELSHWLHHFTPMFEKTGLIMLQLPNGFTADALPILAQFLTQLPKALDFGVEVRSLSFFQKDDNEKRLNQLLIKHNINRIMMDTRPLFNETMNNSAIIDAQQKKPKVPLHVIATGNKPVIRFVGSYDYPKSREFYLPWLKKIKSWANAGKTPYFFFHTADNIKSPQLARQFLSDLALASMPELIFPADKEAKQNSLF